MEQSEEVLDMDVIQALKELGGDGDASLFQELLALYVEDSTQQLERLGEALERNDLKTAERIAHTLKSSSANLGATSVSRLCLQMEQHGRAQRLSEMGALLGPAREAHRRAVAALNALRG